MSQPPNGQFHPSQTPTQLNPHTRPTQPNSPDKQPSFQSQGFAPSPAPVSGRSHNPWLWCLVLLFVLGGIVAVAIALAKPGAAGTTPPATNVASNGSENGTPDATATYFADTLTQRATDAGLQTPVLPTETATALPTSTPKPAFKPIPTVTPMPTATPDPPTATPDASATAQVSGRATIQASGCVNGDTYDGSNNDDLDSTEGCVEGHVVRARQTRGGYLVQMENFAYGERFALTTSHANSTKKGAWVRVYGTFSLDGDDNLVIESITDLEFIQ